MATKPARQKTGSKPVDVDDSESHDDPVEAPGNISIIDEPADIDSFDEFWGDGSENIKVQLYRLEPKFFEGERIDGFIRYLQPGEDPGDIAEIHGGRLYQIRQIITNPGERTRWGKTTRFRVSGAPKLSAPAKGTGLEPNPPAAPGTAAVQIGNETKIEGIPIGGSDTEFAKTMERIALIRAAFPQQQDVNSQIMQLVISLIGKQSSGLDLNGIVGLIGSMRELIPEGGQAEGGTTVLDLVKEGIKAFQQYLETVGKARPAAAPGTAPAKTVQTAPQIAAPAPQKPAPDAPEIAKGENEGMSITQVAEKACSAIVSGFMADPQQTPTEIAGVLEVTLPLDKTTKPILNTFKDKLKAAAINTLNAEYEVEPAEIERFRLFFDQVFDIFVAS